ncbi:MAG: hypothetical protein ACK5MW_05090, partial [Enterococcus sp.]
MKILANSEEDVSFTIEIQKESLVGQETLELAIGDEKEEIDLPAEVVESSTVVESTEISTETSESTSSEVSSETSESTSTEVSSETSETTSTAVTTESSVASSSEVSSETSETTSTEAAEESSATEATKAAEESSTTETTSSSSEPEVTEPQDIRDVLTDAEIEPATILDGFEMTFKDADGNPYPDQTNVPVDANVEINYTWSIPEEIIDQLHEGDYFEFSLPAEIYIRPSTGTLGEYGTYTINA